MAGLGFSISRPGCLDYGQGQTGVEQNGQFRGEGQQVSLAERKDQLRKPSVVNLQGINETTVQKAAFDRAML
jgi:hypothetical protein